MKFTCGKAAAGEYTLSAATRFDRSGATSAQAFGFDLVGPPTTFAKGSCSSDKPFFFSASVPEGNYRVNLVLGSGERSVVTVRAESRRLFIDRMEIAKGAATPVDFNVNVRTDVIAGATGIAAKVKLKPREIGALDWDNKLTLEFNGEHPGLRSISIRPINDVPTLYLAGDSTVVDQDKEPWAAWGQMLPVFFGTGLVVANEAESGETIRSFVGERRLDKILSTIKPGDFLMIQFAHNDQKAGTPEATDYKGYLERYLAAARQHGASVILVTSMNRRAFDTSGKIQDTLLGYPQAMRAFAAEEHLPLIDLNAISKTLFEAMGPEGTLKAFVHYPANTFPGQDAPLADDTHFNAYGAYELARAVVQSLADQKLPLASFLRPDIPVFDPARPDPMSSVVLPQSPLISIEKPYGK
jgi:lysophospholipase L1-like esterase